MNTIQEVANGDFNGNPTSKSAPSVNIANAASSTSSTSSGKSPNRPASQTSFNGSSNSNSTGDKEKVEELKIIGHIKNIEKIAEKRRVFLNNTISEYSVDEKVETETKTVNGDVINSTRSHTREEGAQHIDTAKEATVNVAPAAPPSETKFSTFPKQPKSPPPKPPMLSRTRSLGVGDNRSAPPTPVTPANTPTGTMAPIAQAEMSATPVASPSSAAQKAVVEAGEVAEVQLRDDDVQTARRVERVERPMSLSPASPKQISVNHYERLIEELKCPGCAYPMKAPILLCKTGHSICQQCTRVLLMCPLCKEPFTNMRSLTVEALCSKAHFRCANAVGGCTVRLQIDLLSWHEKQCIYKPMKCFMGRVWGDCDWSGREAYWKDHLEKEHTNKVFHNESIDLIWNMGCKQKPLTGYYVFIVFDEMFNFYEVYDKERVLFTMACTSTVREKKHSYAYEVTLIHQDNEALAITHKYPVHSEYDSDILAEGSCVSIAYSDLAKFIDEERLLHYRVRVMEIKTPRKQKNSQRSSPSSGVHPIDFQQTQIEGVNLKSVPAEVIVTRKTDEIPYADGSANSATTTPKSTGVSDAEGEQSKVKSLYSGKFSSNDSGSESDPEFDAFIAKKWGTPQMHFNRKFLKSHSHESASSTGVNSALGREDRKLMLEDKLSVCSTSTTYKQRVANSLRKSFRGFKTSQLFNRKPSERSISHS